MRSVRTLALAGAASLLVLGSLGVTAGSAAADESGTGVTSDTEQPGVPAPIGPVPTVVPDTTPAAPVAPTGTVVADPPPIVVTRSEVYASMTGRAGIARSCPLRSAGPANSASTLPSRRLRTQPSRPLAVA